jgi:hypothetical protein
MADVNPSVALGINAPDPNQGLQTLSKIMGLGQQGLAIRGQQSENITRAAQATEAQQNAKEKMAGAQLLSDPVGNGLVDSDGNPTPGAQKAIMAAMPTTGAQHYEGILNGARSKIEFNKAANGLQGDLRNEVVGVASGLAADPNVSKDDAKEQFNAYVESKKGTPTYDNVKKIADTVQGIGDHLQKKQDDSGLVIPAGKEAWRNGYVTAARSALGAPAVVGAGGIAAPQGAQVDTGAQIQPGTTSPPLQGGAFTAAGQPIQKVTPPTVTTNAAGQLVRVAPGGAGASVVPTAASPGAQPGQPQQNANPNAAQALGQRGQAEAVSQRVSQVQAQAANTVQAQDALSRAKAILESGQSPDTGTGFEQKKYLKNAMSSLGIDTQGADDMNSLAKNLARYEASRATASGLGGTDAARELAHNGSPNTQLDNKALLGIVRQSLASEKVLSGLAAVQSKTNDPQQQLQNETAFRQIPHPIETVEYMMSRDKQEAEKYLQEKGLSHKDVAASAAALKQFGIM